MRQVESRWWAISTKRLTDNEAAHHASRMSPQQKRAEVASKIVDLDFASIEPAVGEVTNLAPGIGWTRLPLPYEPFHVNVYIFEEDEGWLVVDCGVDNEISRNVWRRLIDGPLSQKPIRKILVTHWHNDHLGLAGWLANETNAQVMMRQAEYFRGSLQAMKPPAVSAERERRHLLAHGTDPLQVESWLGQGFQNLSRISRAPRTYVRLDDVDSLTIGNRQFTVMTVKGHSLSGVALYCPSDNFFVCGDHLSPHLVPNVSVMSDAPDFNPHDDYIATIQTLVDTVSDDAVILPGHEHPFTGLRATIDRIADHHTRLCNRILSAGRAGPLSAAELIPVILRNQPSDMWFGFVIGRVVAYVHFLISRGWMTQVDSGPIIRFTTVRAGELVREDFGHSTGEPQAW